jgi:hypothetical protein
MKKARILFLILALSLLGLALNVTALTLPTPTDSNTCTDRGGWQYEIKAGTDLVRLIIRDQTDHVGTYKAVFVITAPDMQRYSLQKKGSGNAALGVAFPKDFGARWTSGTYTWTCNIGGRQLLQGLFEYGKEREIRLL